MNVLFLVNHLFNLKITVQSNWITKTKVKTGPDFEHFLSRVQKLLRKEQTIDMNV